jgi:hypothetical protein
MQCGKITGMMTKVFSWWGSLLVCLLLSSAVAWADPKPKSVRIIYLVSKDRTEVEEYTAALEHAAKDLQGWYAGQLQGATFRLNDPVVEVLKSDKDAAWFYANPAGANKDNWGFNNALAEAKRLAGARQGDPDYIWVIYSDGPGNKGRGGGGVCVLPEDDLLGLVGRHPTQKSRKRWIAGLGHELGHAFGLPHPKDTKRDADALMWAGFYGKYPEPTYLTDEDKSILNRSRFFFLQDGTPVFSRIKFAERYVYPGGCFARVVGDDGKEWLELKEKGDAQLSFKETTRDENWITLYDAGRRMSIRLPVKGGSSELSMDGGESWRGFYQVKPENHF